MKEHVLDWSKPHHRYFEEMTQIPHGSRREQPYSDYLVRFAKEHELRWKQYPIGNVIIYKDAGIGYENHPTLVLQAHMDMVCEKLPECEHDFEKDPLELELENGWLHAKGTTLGADDGTGVAYILSVLAEKEGKHPPLECIFTVCEEVGLDGAFALEPEDIQGRRYISLDDGGGGMITTTTSAGGLHWEAVFQKNGKPVDMKGYQMLIHGLEGGHSGECIDQEKGNAIKIMARLLHKLSERGSIRIASLSGGSKDNAIPRTASVCFTAELPTETIKKEIVELTGKVKKEYAYSDSKLTVDLMEIRIDSLFGETESDALLRFLMLCPDGFRHRSMKLEGLTTASENLAVIEEEKDCVKVKLSLRGEKESYLDQMAAELRILAELFHVSYSESARYPSWEYEESSFMREKMAEVILACTGKSLQCQAVHGGLECGVFKQKWPDMDMVTMGPVGLDVHTPQERMDMASFDKCFEWFCKFLEAL